MNRRAFFQIRLSWAVQRSQRWKTLYILGASRDSWHVRLKWTADAGLSGESKDNFVGRIISQSLFNPIVTLTIESHQESLLRRTVYKKACEIETRSIH